MNTITSTSSTPAAAATTATTSTQASDNSTTETTGNEQQSPAKFTGRAEKLAVLNSEFNIVSPEFRLSQEFVNRMAELGLISEEDAGGLNAGLPVSNGVQGGETDTVAQMQSFIDDFTSQLEEQDQNPGGLIEILRDAESVLDNLDGSQSTVDIPATAAALDNFLRSDASGELDDKERSSLEQLHTTLAVADKLNPTSRTSANINAYMQVMTDY